MKNYVRKEIKENGTVYYLNKNGQFHRTDGPAIEWRNGDKEWRINGMRHRQNGSSVEFKNGYKHYSINGLCHREDGPAIEYPNGDKFWYLYGIIWTREDFLYLTKYKEKYNYEL